MEEQQKNNPTNKGEGGKKNRHRHHRHHHNKNRQAADGNPSVEKSTPQPNQNQKNKQGQNNVGGNGKQNKKNNHQKNNRPRHERESQIYSPYEELNKEEKYLAELRSKIVIKSADDPSPIFEEKEINAEEILGTPSDAPIHAELTNITEVSEEAMIEVIGIQFRSSSKIYFFDPAGITAKRGQYAIVETARGPEFGEVAFANRQVPEKSTVAPLRPVLRIATEADIAHNEENRKKEKEALAICREKVAAHKLDMKLIDVQYSFDNAKLLFYFTADGRVDFRELVKDLASVFHTRIELRQIGIRDEAKLLGGIGACGRPLCCSTFLPEFPQISIKMAKEQNLSLNTAKISGVCKRLMCCLRYESEVYAEESRLTPPVDSLVKTPDGIGTVISVTPLAGMVRVLLKDENESAPKQYHRDELTVLSREKRGKSYQNAEQNEEDEIDDADD